MSGLDFKAAIGGLLCIRSRYLRPWIFSSGRRCRRLGSSFAGRTSSTWQSIPKPPANSMTRLFPKRGPKSRTSAACAATLLFDEDHTGRSRLCREPGGERRQGSRDRTRREESRVLGAGRRDLPKGLMFLCLVARQRPAKTIDCLLFSQGLEPLEARGARLIAKSHEKISSSLFGIILCESAELRPVPGGTGLLGGFSHRTVKPEASLCFVSREVIFCI